MKIATYFTEPTPKYPNGEQPLFVRNTNSKTGTVNLVNDDGVLVIGQCPVSEVRGKLGSCVIGGESSVDIEARSVLVDAVSVKQTARDNPKNTIAEQKALDKELLAAEAALESFDKSAKHVTPASPAHHTGKPEHK